MGIKKMVGRIVGKAAVLDGKLFNPLRRRVGGAFFFTPRWEEVAEGFEHLAEELAETGELDLKKLDRLCFEGYMMGADLVESLDFTNRTVSWAWTRPDGEQDGYRVIFQKPGLRWRRRKHPLSGRGVVAKELRPDGTEYCILEVTLPVVVESTTTEGYW